MEALVALVSRLKGGEEEGIYWGAFVRASAQPGGREEVESWSWLSCLSLPPAECFTHSFSLIQFWLICA